MAEIPTPPFEPDRFRSAAEFYDRGRAAYAPALVGRVAGIVGLEPEHRLLDLGCGTGPLARAFAPCVSEVVALDPSTEMLSLARKLAAEARNITFVQASSYDLGPALGQFRLVVMGRSFHWMDRADTLRRLDQMVQVGGAVALFHDTAPKVAANSWRALWREIAERYAGSPSAHRDPDWVRHEDMLLNSAFSRLERFGVIERRPLDVQTLIERTLSMSVTSPSQLGDRTQAMVEDLRAGLAGVSEEVVESTALIAWRP
jgi:SAM-dependent methyltransferase